MVLVYYAHSGGMKGGLPSLPGHYRCHTEKEDRRRSISAKIEYVFAIATENKKSKTRKGNRKRCLS